MANKSTTTSRNPHRDAALTALTLAIEKLDTIPPSQTTRYMMADLMTARDEVGQIEELIRARRPRKPKAPEVTPA